MERRLAKAAAGEVHYGMEGARPGLALLRSSWRSSRMVAKSPRPGVSKRAMPHPAMTSLVKRDDCGRPLDVARTFNGSWDGIGTSEESQVFRHRANPDTVDTREGTPDVHALIRGRAQTGLQAFF